MESLSKNRRDMGGMNNVIVTSLPHFYMEFAHFPSESGGKKDGKLFTFRYMGSMLTWQRYKSDGISEALASTSYDKTVYTVLLMCSEVEATSPNTHKSTLHICLYRTGFCRINAVKRPPTGKKKPHKNHGLVGITVWLLGFIFEMSLLGDSKTFSRK